MKKFLLSFVLLICGCSYNIMTAHPLPEKNKLDVEVIFTRGYWPKCKYKEMAFLISSENSTPHGAVSELRENAAEIGADFIKIDRIKTYYRLFTDTTSMMATAYSCDEMVNRERAPTKR